LFLAEEDQALAAEPGFHHNPPQGGGAMVMSLRRVFDHRSEPLEQQPKNGLALAFGPAQTLGVVVKDGASRAAILPWVWLKL
jgi:hypothetical protein